MRKLKTEKNIKIDNEAVIGLNINKYTGETTVMVASGYVSDGKFIPVEDHKEYKIKDCPAETSETIYFAEVDKQNSPSIEMHGLCYRAKVKGVSLIYSAQDDVDVLSVTVTGKVIDVKVESMVTTNQEIIDVVEANGEAMALLYKLEIIDLNTKVDISLAPIEIV